MNPSKEGFFIAYHLIFVIISIKDMQKSKLENLINCLRQAFEESGAHVTEDNIEHISVVVYDSMSHPGRNFHNIQHIFDVAEGLNGISVIAAVFHDIVYYQVDQGFRHFVEQMVFKNVEFSGDHFLVKKSLDPIIEKAQTIFGLNPGANLNVFNGLNEYLSAIVAINLLRNIYDEITLLKIVGLIEATIPFRKDPIDVLENRFKKLGFGQLDIEDLCKRSVDFSNSDVLNFSEKDPRRFLNNTWNLISETNYSLRRGLDNYSVTDYRSALLKTYNFFKSLDPDTVFNNFKNYPPEKKVILLKEMANRNVSIGRDYLKIKLVAIGMIEAISHTTGGNAPMSLFMGDIRRREQKIERMEDYLGAQGEVSKDIDQDVMLILESGRAQESSFDMKGSPLPAFIYKHMGKSKIDELFPHVLEFFHESIDSRSLLKSYPKFILERVFLACAEVSSTRKEKLIKTLHSLDH